MDDYSYVVNDAQITYTTIGKFCSIAAMTRINPGNHPMQRASQAHFTYRASAYFPGESDDAEFFAWRREHHVHIGHDVWIGHGAIVLPGRNDRHRRGDRGRRHRDQGRSRLHHRRRQSGAADQAAVSGRRSPTGWRSLHGGTGTMRRFAAPCPISASSTSRTFSRSTRSARASGRQPFNQSAAS